ncbi:MAG: glutamate racemase [Eubacterium sp.]|nr:glutamate racemase [Eubacterium sp.]
MNPERYAPIGVFDSGLGGLTVVREIMRNLPDERIVYFGDTARVPYGNKSKETVIRYARQIVNFLKTQNVKAIVVACNTASALALDTIRPEIDLPIIGVVRPGTEMALKATKNKRIGVIATDSTIRSNLYQTLLREHDKEVRVYAQACPLFVPLVEEGWTKDPVTHTVAERYLADILEQGIDTLIMGCTHYPLLRTLLREVTGESVQLINPAYETAQALRRLLDDHALLNDGRHQIAPQYAFFASDTVEKFNAFANSILPYEISSTTKVQIEQY